VIAYRPIGLGSVALIGAVASALTAVLIAASALESKSSAKRG